MSRFTIPLLFFAILAAPDARGQDALSGVLINEIGTDPVGTPGFDANGDATVDAAADEFIELYNSTGAAVDISGWELREDGLAHTFAAGTSIPAGGYVLVVDTYPSPPANTFQANGSLSLGNSGENVYLCNPATGSYVEVATGNNAPGADANDLTGTSCTTRVGSGEATNVDGDGQSEQRLTDGAPEWAAADATPGATNNMVAPVVADVIINEVDANVTDEASGDFVEVYALSGTTTALDGLVLVLYNGNGNAVYGVLDLDGFTTNASGYAYFGNNAGAAATIPGSTSPSVRIQNGADAVAIYEGDGADFSVGDQPTTTNLVDAVVYGSTSVGRDADLLAALGLSVQYDESFEGNADAVSLQRLNALPITANVASAFSGAYYVSAPTPGAVNPSSVTVDVTDEVNGNPDDGIDGSAEAAGWRMPALPGYEADGTTFEVDDLAGINLVQGVPAGGTFGAQYPGAFPNIFTSSDGTSTGDPLNGYTAPSSTAEALPPGDGLLWYFYDQNFTGTASDGFDLANAAFSLSVVAIPPDNLINGGTPYSLTVTAVEPYQDSGGPPANVADTRFFMIGNPGGYPYVLGGVDYQAGAGETLQTSFYTWNAAVGTTSSQGQPVAGSYEISTADFTNPFAGEDLGRFNGAYAEVTFTGTAPTTGTFEFPSEFYRPRSSEGFIGKGGADDSRLALRLDGVVTTASGDDVPVVDVAAMLRFRDDAETGWDIHDGTKPLSLATHNAMIAPVGTLGDRARRQGVLSLPSGSETVMTFPVAFSATDAGAFTFSWDAVPMGWGVTLRDTQTGDVVNFEDAGSYAFTSGATDWTNRFELTLTPASVVNNEPTPEAGLSLSAPTPNPTRGAVRFALNAEAPVRAAVYDALGREVAVLHDGPLAGPRVLTLDTATLSAGVYVIRAEGTEGAVTQRFTVAR